MCRYRHVCNNYRCGHQEPLTPLLIQCNSANCKFSPNHDPNCVPPRCRQTCTQYHGYPEQYAPHLRSVCPDCSRAGYA